MFDETLFTKAYNVGSCLTDLLTVQPMHGASVNGWVDIPLTFVIMIYFMAITITAASVAYFMKKKNPFVQALRKSVLIAFFCSGLLYLVYSERTWYEWLRHDVDAYSGKSTEEKTFIDFGSIYDFALAAQKALKDGEYTLYTSNKSFSLIAQYYLLPKRNRTNSKNILVFYDTDAIYDDSTKTFIKGDTRVENAEMIFRYDAGAYMLRIR
ncbi:MAG TPA: hypothetical protein VEM40_11185 [Nitrospirota bacterium]|nr:hypothetical protein [Nitrospirota bacterium]